MQQKVHKQVQQYYGQTLKTSQDLLTNACCVTNSKLTAKQKQAMSLINQEIIRKFYGCGSPIPPDLEGKIIIDLGCGSGVDSYLASYFVNQTGKAIGIDMTQAQLDIANKNIQSMTKKYGFSKPNIEFKLGNIQKIDQPNDFADVIISNCVLNLVPQKQAVFKEIWRVLKPGGQLYFSDVYSDRRISEKQRSDKTLWGQCLSGALYVQDFRRIMQKTGCPDCRLMSKSKITINNQKIEQQVQGINFFSITYRCLKLDDLEDRCQDYGQQAVYLGGIDQNQQEFILDAGHVFRKNKSVKICGNTASMLSKTRYAKYFQVSLRKQHRGLFNCATNQSSNCEGSSCC